MCVGGGVLAAPAAAPCTQGALAPPGVFTLCLGTPHPFAAKPIKLGASKAANEYMKLQARSFAARRTRLPPAARALRPRACTAAAAPRPRAAAAAAHGSLAFRLTAQGFARRKELTAFLRENYLLRRDKTQARGAPRPARCGGRRVPDDRPGTPGRKAPPSPSHMPLL